MGENKIVKKSEQKPTKISQNFLDKLFKNVTLFFAVIIVALMVWMVIALIIQSKLSIEKFGFSFITSTNWDPVNDEFGALPFIYGTIMSSIIAVVIATPISIGIGLFLTQISNKWMKTIIGFMVQILASIPSILYGLWGLFIFVPFIRDYFQKPVSSVLG
ncbi:MAG: phosphate ABC transporter permease subunit PstC, partial [Clostridiaceae bacterium]|nr:phosphate ABC transporter permease subunit PstC [Clostridiaceae bacterium]